MKDKKRTLRIFNFTNPMMDTEFLSIGSNKYSKAVSFNWEFVNEYQNADVVIWDGVVTLKNKLHAEKMMNDFKSSKFLLLVEGAKKLSLDKDSFVIDTDGIHYARIFSWGTLPEEILLTFESFWQKLNHV